MAHHKLDGVPMDLLPEEAKNGVLDFIRMQTRHSISPEEKEQQTRYFRGLSERSLAYLCPKLNS